MEQFEIDRSAIVSVYKQQNLSALLAATTRGEFTPELAARAHQMFMKSALLQSLVTRDVEAVEAMLKGQVH